MAPISLTSKSRFNSRLVPYVRGDSTSWLPLCSSQPFLWLSRLADNNYWPRGYWIIHDEADYFSLQIVLEGELDVTKEGRQYRVSTGEAIVIPPGTVKLATGAAGKCLKRYIIFSGQILSAFKHELNFDTVNVITQFCSEKFDRLFSRAFQLSSLGDVKNAEEFSTLAFAIILYTAGKLQKSSLPPSIVACREYIENNIAKKITVEELARVACCSKSTLKWQFNKYFNMSPGRYLTSIRLDYASRLMKDSTLPLSVKQIAARCGYENPLYFSKVFKTHFDCQPSQYKKKIRSAMNADTP